MRISDWSSDVCSSDLECINQNIPVERLILALDRDQSPRSTPCAAAHSAYWPRGSAAGCARIAGMSARSAPRSSERIIARSEERRVGNSVSVRVDLGGRRLIEKKKQERKHNSHIQIHKSNIRTIG